MKDQVFNYENPVVFKESITPKVDSIEPAQGSSMGGTVVTISGEGFDAKDTLVEIDGVKCEVSSATEKELVCTTGKKSSKDETGLVVRSLKNGFAGHARNVKFTYLDDWSNALTWEKIGSIPMDNTDLIIAKGINLVVDVEAIPRFNDVIVYGSLIFKNTKDVSQQHLHCNKIILIGGNLFIGSEKEPLTSNLVLTIDSVNYKGEYSYDNGIISSKNGQVQIYGND